jgi:phosphoenolpyruvate synthase/pyruvate phosphate dikinase
MKYIQFFSHISKRDSKLYGGKAASLGEMYQAGIPVPNGFGISIEAHRQFKGKPLSPEFKAELHHAYRKLKTQRVAVRSSAVAEDASDASWAGQLESYLNVNDAILEASVRKCWKSVEAGHVKDYAKGKILGKDDLLVGVAVQAMVAGDSAGVMFTVNPVTGNKNELVIESAYGLGEMVVQGAVTPDKHTVDTKRWQVTSFGINIKERMMVFRGGKNRTTPVPLELADRAVLREDKVLQLAAVGLRIAQHYGAPQDIEWAIKGGKIYIVQARPITTL